MQVLTQFPLLKALGWALFNSLWQMAFLWLLYNLLSSIFHTSAARIRHGLALVLLSIGTINFMITHDDRNLFRKPKFLICIGFIIYFFYMILYYWAEEVSAAVKRHIDPATITIIKAGDFKKAGITQ